MLTRRSPTQASFLATCIWLAGSLPGCGGKTDSDDKADTADAEAAAGGGDGDRAVVTSDGAAGAGGAADSAAGLEGATAVDGDAIADDAGESAGVKRRLNGKEAVVPNLGGARGRLIEGWDGLKAGMKPKDLLRERPRARGSDLTPLVYTETLDSPWIAASYRFERLTSKIAHVQWLAGPLASGKSVFRGMSRQGLHRWRRRPRFSQDANHRRAHFDTEAGPVMLTMANADGRIKLEWRPPNPDGPDPLQAALDRVAAGAGGDVGTRPPPRTGPASPARPLGAPAVARP